MHLSTMAALGFGFASSARAASVTITNQCSFTVYLWSTAADYNVQMQTLPAGSGSYSETYRKNSDGGGISIKIASTTTVAPALQANITQLEYTLSDSLYYDISNINGFPFTNDGLQLLAGPADSSHPSCINVTCTAGQEYCEAAYNEPDQKKTLSCATAADIELNLCSNGGSSSAASSPPPASSSVAVANNKAYVAPSSSSTPSATTLSVSTITVSPVAAEPTPNPNVVYEVITNYVTEIYTAIEKREPAPTMFHRHAHRHEHKRRSGA